MNHHDADPFEIERYELREAPRYTFSLSRRAFVQSVGAGLFIAAFVDVAGAQERGGRGAQQTSIGGRFHIDKDGVVTCFTSKVEVGQGSRTELSQAVAEELHVPLAQVRLVMADTSVAPNDGGTAGSQTTPRTVPAVRQAAAATRVLLIELACKQWGVSTDGATMIDGVLAHPSGKKLTLAELVNNATDLDTAMNARPTEGAVLTPPDAWQVLGQPILKPTAADIARGKHRYASDIKRPGMVYGRVLRAPSYDAELVSIDTKAAEAMAGVTVVHDGAFVGVTAPTSFAAQQALAALEATAKWTEKPHPPSTELFAYLKKNVREGGGRDRGDSAGDVDAAFAAGPKVLRASYEIPYIQHAPMETRAAVAEFVDGSLTVWTGSQQPSRVREEVAQALALPQEKVRVIVPDTGGGFGGKHTGDAAVEAARLALSAKKPVSVHWTRKEEFTWAYFRPAGVIDIAAAVDKEGKVAAWDHTNYNSGGSGIACPYTFAAKRTQSKNCDSPLRQGSYRALASTANNFAREAFIDELALAQGADPLAFRLSNLADDRLRNVLIAAATKFGWAAARADKKPGAGTGIACGTEKGSFVATCAEVHVNESGKEYAIKRAVIAFECGAVLNPKNLQSQIEGAVIMGLGAILREAMQFQDGKIINCHFKQYEVPRFSDVPELDIVVLNRPDLPSVGAGETPIIAIAPAVANALLHATGKAQHALPLRLV